MDNKISIKNDDLAKLVMFKLNKIDNEFTQDELYQIKELIIDYQESDFDILEELLLFPSLENLTLRDFYIYNDDYHIFLKLKNLNVISFINCEMEDADLICSLKLEGLSLIHCQINNYRFVNLMKNLKELTIVNANINDIKINELVNLNYLQISYCTLNDDVVININNLEELYLDNTNIHNLSFVCQLPNLKRLSIDEKQYEENKEAIKKLISKKILILNENMTSFGGM